MRAGIGINGCGRMGRLVLRAAWARTDFAWRRVNDCGMDAAGAAHLLGFDSVHGRWAVPCTGAGETLELAGTPIAYSASPTIEGADWRGCDLVIEATGVHHKTPARWRPISTRAYARCWSPRRPRGLEPGLRREPRATIPRSHVVTAASCTTNCLAPIVQVMHQNIGIVHGSMTTLHALTNTQRIVDRAHSDLRRARACGQSLIPTTTGSARAITEIFPELAGRLDGHAVRVPLLHGSLLDFVFEAAREVSVEEVNGHLRTAAAAGPLAGILGYEERPLVSVDFVHDARSAIVDAPSTLVVDGTQVKIYAWYDNEWAYVQRLVDLAALLARTL